VSSLISPIAAEQKLLRSDMNESLKEMRNEMTQNQKEMLAAVSKIDDKYALHGERLAKLEK
jgi:hypothetical protein